MTTWSRSPCDGAEAAFLIHLYMIPFELSGQSVTPGDGTLRKSLMIADSPQNARRV